VGICQNLIGIDSSNYGDGSGPCEREAAEFAAGLLTDVGCDVEVYEPAPRRTSLVTRIEGTDPSRPALVLHGHTDVVPAIASDWSVDPFGGEERDGMLWGRGAVDMKDMDAMIISVVREWMRTGRRPQRDIIVAIFADEEAGGVMGAHWSVEHRPELFEGATEAVSEVGGFSISVAGQRAYLIQTAEKGIRWLKMIAEDRAGHGSMIHPDNAIVALAEAVERIGRYRWDISLTDSSRAFLRGVADLTGLPFTEPREDAELRGQIDDLLQALGPVARFVGSGLQHSANVTGLTAGYKHNVIPGRAEAWVDCRPLPGRADEASAMLAEVAGPGVRWETVIEDVGLEAPVTGALMDAMTDALHAEDPQAAVLPYMMAGGTDNKSMSLLGITGYGFAPARLPEDLDFTALFHGIDERIPLDALRFGTRVLDRFLMTC
jgi:acetylornithine deacetylase/succinyl-diaminopimelate desuccinylase-like protein